MSLRELEEEVQRLSPADLSAFTRWLDAYAAERWDEQLARDQAAGKLDALMRRADADFEAGRCQEL